ncbi:MAG: hypothetical protein L6Q92_05485 [Phycisphaerae bacterium]|nr:hypothetical protein [Phycisphaerae bacterium]
MWPMMILLSLVLAAGGLKRDPPSPTSRPKNEAAAALRAVVKDARFDAMPLEDFAEWLERQTKMNVIVRWAELKRHGITQDTPITLDLRNVKLSRVVTAALNSIAPEDEPLGYQASENFITLSTKRDLGRQMVTRIYDVQDLLVVVPNFRGDDLNTDDIGRGSRRPQPGPLVRQSGGKSESDPLAGANDRIRQLVAAITQTIEPDSWAVNGGRGTISYFQGRLVIRNSPEVHEKLRGTLGP